MHDALDLSPLSGCAAVAVATSGGGDSMALLHYLAHRATCPVHALTVNHNLRPEAAAEAAAITTWVSAWPHVQHHILQWEGEKPETSLMDAARTARYALMDAYCHAHKIPLLALAHHADDQLETFFMRLTKGSGLDGLAGMRPLTPYGDGLQLWRPCLALTHTDLIDYCRTHNVPWVEDPTNSNTKYTRNRLRAAQPLLEAEGLTSKRLRTIMARLQRASDTLSDMANTLDNAATVAQADDHITYRLSDITQSPLELIVRVLGNALRRVGQTQSYGPRLENVEALATRLKNNEDIAITLGGCTIRTDQARNTLKIRAENR